ncbi:Polysaccharide biosynthesis C-terminal domain protein [Acididesulfobacillus acetoxydans]|uniref:Polysaccharide biosynthesis C-terminal domain protein n=1 Tax=Acididesulfobacillus acetoxydans TaxID=1561005 RepID=A0A8S0W694_9FIRM|nr:polysaccharide biosynthesis C-terminal domain-containing protein [Acididesulfobacillus acetoxydans]CAA7599629.1 Polysaccharide biosynthesis C-terminal domain protein [Acididesulfobacillus acetoxydans]CEJ06460.1 Polysaccharide biosynthesis protein [Acididesulfobacillus acetoxydans]
MGFTKSVTITFLSNMFLFLLSFISATLLSRVLGPAGAGVWNVASNFLTFGTLILGLGLSAANVFFLGKNRRDLGGIVGNNIVLTLLSAIILVPFYYLNTRFHFQFLRGVSDAQMLMVLLAVPFMNLKASLLNVLLGLQDVVAYNRVNVGDKVLNLILLVALFFYLASPSSAILAALAGTVIVNVWEMAILVRLVRRRDFLEKVPGREIPERESLKTEIPERESLGREISETESLGREIPERESLGREISGTEISKTESLGREISETESLGREIPERESLGREISGTEISKTEIPGTEIPEREIPEPGKWSRSGALRYLFSLDFPLMGRMLGYGLKAQVGNFIQRLNYSLDVFIVNYFLPLNQVGMYWVAVTLGKTLWAVSGSIATVILPVASSATNQGELDTFTNQVTRVSLALIALFSLVLGIISRPLIIWWFTYPFAPAAEAFLWLLPGVAIFSISNILANYLAGVGLVEKNIYSAVISGVVTVVLDFVLIPRIGINGASIATSLSYITFTLTTLYFYVRHTRCRWQDVLILKGADLALMRQTLSQRFKH